MYIYTSPNEATPIYQYIYIYTIYTYIYICINHIAIPGVSGLVLSIVDGRPGRGYCIFPLVIAAFCSLPSSSRGYGGIVTGSMAFCPGHAELHDQINSPADEHGIRNPLGCRGKWSSRDQFSGSALVFGEVIDARTSARGS